MERRLDDADFESSRRHEQVAFEDKETWSEARNDLKTVEAIRNLVTRNK